MNIFKAEFIISNTDMNKCPAPTLPEVAFIGRSNVGKSSLINMLALKKELAKISATPGKTQLLNHFNINDNMFWVDLPGYGYAKVSQGMRKDWTKMIWDYLENRNNLKTLFVLIDSRHDAQKIDLNFVNQLGEKNIPFTLIFTKSDKSTQAIVSKNVKNFMNCLKKTWEVLPVYFVSSSVKRLGRDKILTYIEDLCLENK